MSTALSWERAEGLPAEIAALFGTEAELLLAIPEHKVALPGGQRESQCDVFALVRSGAETLALAVEAKVEEPFGPTVGEWLTGAGPSKHTRLRFICELLGREDPPPHLRYQLLHRTAAALIEARRFGTDAAAMIVQSFSPEQRWFDDFAAFCNWLDLPSATGEAHRLTRPGERPLILGWANCAPITP